MKNECDIIKDLLPNYIENLLSKETEKYVEDHINNCSKCKQTLEMMKDEKNKIKNNEKREEQLEINFLKKYNKRMLGLKIVSLIFILVILIMCILFVIKFCNVNSIISDANSKKQELSQTENYSIHTTLYHIDYQTRKQYITYDEYYYKEGKYKEVSKIYGINFIIQGSTSSLRYGNVDSNGQKERYINNLFESYSLYFEDLGFFNNVKVRTGLVLNETVREDKFGETECYVFRDETEDYYKEIWIDKYSLIPIKEVQEVYDKMYDEKIISFHIGEVEDEDVKAK